MADVKWTFFADTASAERAIQGLEQKYAKLEHSITQVSRKTKAESSSVVQAFDSWTKGIATVAGALGAASAAAAVFSAANQQLIREADELAIKSDAQTRRLRVQAGLSELQGEAAKKAIRAASGVFGMTDGQGFDAATQLVSTGFSAQQATGPALVEFLRVLAASNQTGKEVDSQALAKAMASYLNSQSMELNAANVAAVGTAMQRLFKATNLQLTDLESLAKVGSVLKGPLTQQEQFANFATLTTEGALPGAEAAVAMRNIVSNLTTAAGDKTKEEGLAALGIKPEQVDLIGESFSDVVKVFGERVKATAPEAIAPAMKKLFGVETVAPFQTILNNAGKNAERMTILGDRAGLLADAAITTGGREAAANRVKARLEQQRADASEQDNLYADTIESVAVERGVSGFGQVVQRGMYYGLRGLNVPQNVAAYMATGGTDAYATVREQVDEARKPADQQTKLLERVAKSNEELVQLERQKAGKQPQLNRNAQGEGAR